MRGTAVLSGVIAAAMLVIAGCSADPVVEPPPEQVVDLAKLDVGTYPTVPREITTTPSWELARYMEGVRLGSVLPLPAEIDPQFVASATGGRAFPTPTQDLNEVFGDGFGEDAKGLIAGLTSVARSHEDINISQTLSVQAMLFDSPEAAQSAAVALHRRGDGPDAAVEQIESAYHPSALMVWRNDAQRVTAWMAAARFVIKVGVWSDENKTLAISDQAALVPLADKAMTVTAQRLAAYIPTPVDRLPSIPVDPDKMLARTLPVGSETGGAREFPTLEDGHGALHGAVDLVNTRRINEAAGVDRVAQDKSTVYRTRDAESARWLLAEAGHDKFLRPIEGPVGLAAAACYESLRPNTGSRYFCGVSHDRYAAVVSSSQASDVRQAISAQYAILVNAG
ncbi:DUF7373 family lipoprotein [Nocardia ignorata]|nr:hypothetical protein [Nocardia ignorata]